MTRNSARLAWLTLLLALGGLLYAGRALAQNPSERVGETGAGAVFERCATIYFRSLANGQEVPEEGRTVLQCSPAASRIHVEEPGSPLPRAARESRYIDFAGEKTYQLAEFPDGGRCSVISDFASLPELELTEDREEILGYRCRRARTVVRSNQIDLWFTQEAGLRGSPYISLLVPNALVLRVVRNGNYEILADSLAWSPSPCAETLLPTDFGDVVDAAAYRFRVTESYVTMVEVFHDEQICFRPDEEKAGREGRTEGRGQGEEGRRDGDGANRIAVGAVGDSVQRFAGGTLIVRKIRLPVVGADAMVFAEIVQSSNGDAYDRTGSVFLIPADRDTTFLDGLRSGLESLPVRKGRDGTSYQGVAASPGYAPPLEMVRFITPFGIRFYNEQVTVQGVAWEDSAVYKVDLTDLLPVLQGEVWIGAFIGNYDRGGHRLSLRLRYHPGSRRVVEGQRSRRWVLPLFNTVNVLEMAGQAYGRMFAHDSLAVAFEAPAGLTSCHLRYITTGHGGWEHGDEFNPRTNTILLDGVPLAAVTPWRSDCATYRRLNPASGNFWNGVSSSDLSRSGWCPGQPVDPVILPIGDLAPGRHVLKVAIPMGEPEGGSFSAWNVSGVLIGEF